MASNVRSLNDDRRPDLLLVVESLTVTSGFPPQADLSGASKVPGMVIVVLIAQA